MNYSTFMGVISGLLQLVVACYALRLSWRFGTARVGWLVFGAFSLLALFHTLLALNPFRVGLESGIIPDVAYAVVSVLLLSSIVRLESSLKKHWQTQREERRSLSEWETKVESQVEELTKANEDLRRLGTKLQVEVAEQKQLREQEDQTYQGLLAAARQTEKDLLQTIATLLAEAAEQKQGLAAQQQQGLAAARQAGRSEAAASVLESVNALTSSVTDQVRASTSRIVLASKLARFSSSPGGLKPGPHRKRLPDSLAQLARHFSGDQTALLHRIDSLKGRLEQIQATGTLPAGLAAESPAEPAQSGGDFQQHVLQNVTETGTELPAGEPDAALQEASKEVKDQSEARV